MKLLTIFVLLLFVKGCSETSVNPENVKFGESFTIQYQKSVEVGKELQLTFSLLEESRCPEGVQCIRAGELFTTLLLKHKTSGETNEATFCVAGECLAKRDFTQKEIYYSGDKLQVGNDTYTINIQDFSPKESQQSSDAGSYNLTLMIENK